MNKIKRLKRIRKQEGETMKKSYSGFEITMRL
jgi:hypothetical protein